MDPDAGFKSSPTGTRPVVGGFVAWEDTDKITIVHRGDEVTLLYDQIYTASATIQLRLLLALTIGDYAEAIRVAKEIA